MRGSLTFAAAALVALLLALSTPAAANGPFPIDVVGGTFTTAVNTFDLAAGAYGATPCPEKPSTLAMDFDGTATAGTWTITGTRSLQIEMGTAGSGLWFQADITYLNGSGGAYAGGGTPPPTATLNGTMGIRIDVHYIGDEDDPNCVKGLSCRILGAFTITSSSYDGNALPNPLPGDTLDLTSSTSPALVVQSCQAPFSALGGTSATLVQNIVFQ